MNVPVLYFPGEPLGTSQLSSYCMFYFRKRQRQTPQPPKKKKKHTSCLNSLHLHIVAINLYCSYRICACPSSSIKLEEQQKEQTAMCMAAVSMFLCRVSVNILWVEPQLSRIQMWLYTVTMQQNNACDRSPVTATWACSCKALDCVCVCVCVHLRGGGICILAAQEYDFFFWLRMVFVCIYLRLLQYILNCSKSETL